MASQWWRGDTSRKILKRIVLKGTLTLETPAHLGNGEGDVFTDMPLFVDPYDGRSPIIYGASLAGSLRAYLEKRLGGKAKAGEVEKLFGAIKGNDAGEQSPLIVDDAPGELPDNLGIEQRTGVRIDPASRTAQAKKLFEAELWPAGTKFALSFELVIRERDHEQELKELLAMALEGLSDGGITLGARKSRGWGRVTASEWRMAEFDFTRIDDLIAWIQGPEARLRNAARHDKVMPTLGLSGIRPDARRYFQIDATFGLEGSMLIRWVGGVGDPDLVHLQSYRHGGGRLVPVLPGTSLAGVLRARAERIVNTLSRGGNGFDVVEALFGPILGEENGSGQNPKPRGSKLSVQEAVVENAVHDLVQTRVSIDRFTGGTRHGALFNEQPIFAKEDTRVHVGLTLEDPQDWEIGLLLLLLKDLWTGDLPVGGEASVGRGRLRGQKARLISRDGGRTQEWSIVNNGNGLKVKGDTQGLENFVEALCNKLRGQPTQVSGGSYADPE